MRTYGPKGDTPVIEEYLSRDHLSAISGITPDGKLYMMVQERAYKSPDVVNFLEHLLRHIPGKLLIIWDRSPIHRARVIKDYLACGAAARIHLEQFPAYAPELNPDEGIWNYLKRVELKNLACQNISELRTEIRKAKERMRHKVDAIAACIEHAGLY
jgi:transposase